MFVFIMRHGEAAAGADSDAARELTDSGRQDVMDMIERCQAELANIDEIWASPYVRAQQTAMIAADKLGKSLVTQNWLTPTDNTDNVLTSLREAEKTILLVSHQPLVGTLVDRFADLEPGRYRMGTSAIACVETEFLVYGCGELRWLHQPQV
ncbi:MAG: phosphohistidine phosphatase SixA [Cellvibrionaceae bacterium]